jgi:hypothetical protein
VRSYFNKAYASFYPLTPDDAAGGPDDARGG